MNVAISPKGEISVNGVVLSPLVMSGERFYNLSMLKDAIKGERHSDINSIMRRKTFLELVELVSGKSLRKTPNVVRALKGAGLYKTSGRRDEMTLYCHESVFLVLLCELSPNALSEILKEYIKVV